MIGKYQVDIYLPIIQLYSFDHQRQRRVFVYMGVDHIRPQEGNVNFVGCLFYAFYSLYAEVHGIKGGRNSSIKPQSLPVPCLMKRWLKSLCRGCLWTSKISFPKIKKLFLVDSLGKFQEVTWHFRMLKDLNKKITNNTPK